MHDRHEPPRAVQGDEPLFEDVHAEEYFLGARTGMVFVGASDSVEMAVDLDSQGAKAGFPIVIHVGRQVDADIARVDLGDFATRVEECPFAPDGPPGGREVKGDGERWGEAMLAGGES